MIPILLDLLTLFFLVAGLVLLWLNLRERRRRKVHISPQERHKSQNDFRDEPDVPD